MVAAIMFLCRLGIASEMPSELQLAEISSQRSAAEMRMKAMLMAERICELKRAASQHQKAAYIPPNAFDGKMAEAKAKDERLIAEGKTTRPPCHFGYPNTPNMATVQRGKWAAENWNSEIASYRVSLLEKYTPLLAGYLQGLDEMERPKFRRFFTECARLTPKEEERFLGAGCRDETSNERRTQADPSTNQKRDRREVKKWSDTIMNEPNRRARVPLKNIHGCLNSYFMVFTNRIERENFPWMKSHGLPAERHEYWRRRLDAAYEMKDIGKKSIFGLQGK